MNSLLKLLAAGLLASALTAHAAEVDPASVPEKKRTVLAKYLNAADVPGFIAQQGRNVLFIDVRTPQELQLVGFAQGIDANIPIVHFRYDRWNEKLGDFDSEVNPDFVSQVENLAFERGVDTNAAIVVMCRSGDRSTKAVTLLSEAGYKNVWSVVDGFEGDMASSGPNKGKRNVNGWKNAGLPWAYKPGKPLFHLSTLKSDAVR